MYSITLESPDLLLFASQKNESSFRLCYDLLSLDLFTGVPKLTSLSAFDTLEDFRAKKMDCKDRKFAQHLKTSSTNLMINVLTSTNFIIQFL